MNETKNVSFVIFADDGYVIDALVLDGIFLDIEKDRVRLEYVLENVSKNHEFEACFAQLPPVEPPPEDPPKENDSDTGEAPSKIGDSGGGCRVSVLHFSSLFLVLPLLAAAFIRRGRV